MNQTINKIKLIILMIMSVVLYQLPCLTMLDCLKYVYLPLTVVIWILGIKNIEKDTAFKKLILYGVAILWCICLLFKMEVFHGESGYQKYCFLSPILLFVIGKILTLNFVKYKIEENNIDLLIICIFLFILAYLIDYFLFNIFFINDYFYLICGLISSSICIIQLFNILNIRVEKNIFILISVIISVIIILIINKIAMNKIKKVIMFQRELCDIIYDNNLTYKNISTELGPYSEIEYKESLGFIHILDYQMCIYNNRRYVHVINTNINEINRSNFKEKIEKIRGTAYTISELINVGELYYNNRKIVIYISIIMVSGIGLVTIINKRFNE